MLAYPEPDRNLYGSGLYRTLAEDHIWLYVCVQCLGEKQQAISHVEKLFEESRELVCIILSYQMTAYADGWELLC